MMCIFPYHLSPPLPITNDHLIQKTKNSLNQVFTIKSRCCFTSHRQNNPVHHPCPVTHPLLNKPTNKQQYYTEKKTNKKKTKPQKTTVAAATTATRNNRSGGRSRPFGHVLPVKVIRQGNQHTHTYTKHTPHSERHDSRPDTVRVALAFVQNIDIYTYYYYYYYLFGERCCRRERQST